MPSNLIFCYRHSAFKCNFALVSLYLPQIQYCFSLGCQIWKFSPFFCPRLFMTTTTREPPTISTFSQALRSQFSTTINLSWKTIMCLLSFSKSMLIYLNITVAVWGYISLKIVKLGSRSISNLNLKTQKRTRADVII